MARYKFFRAALAAAIILPISAAPLFAGPRDDDKTHPAKSEDTKKPGRNCKGDGPGDAKFRDCIAKDAHGDKTPGKKAKDSTH